MEAKYERRIAALSEFEPLVTETIRGEKMEIDINPVMEGESIQILFTGRVDGQDELNMPRFTVSVDPYDDEAVICSDPRYVKIEGEIERIGNPAAKYKLQEEAVKWLIEHGKFLGFQRINALTRKAKDEGTRAFYDSLGFLPARNDFRGGLGGEVVVKEL